MWSRIQTGCLGQLFRFLLAGKDDAACTIRLGAHLDELQLTNELRRSPDEVINLIEVQAEGAVRIGIEPRMLVHDDAVYQAMPCSPAQGRIPARHHKPKSRSGPLPVFF